ncbi:MAG: DUF3465 domain-containing protein [Gammaproteobacteria bacterium]|nr:DUF3465 domain-containing protein [Gammaproteobacteria bacterium]
MKKFVFLILLAALLGYGYLQEPGISTSNIPTDSQSSLDRLQTAYANRQSGVQVKGYGVVTKILTDDLEGSRHQRFILKLESGQSLLVAHNIDLAPRIFNLRTGDAVEFYGEYEWNDKGGVIHWTHHDPNHRHVAGWLKHGGKTYQ